MVKAQGKKAAARGPKGAARKAATRVKSAVKAVGSKVSKAKKAVKTAVAKKPKAAVPSRHARPAKGAKKPAKAPSRPVAKAKSAGAKVVKAAKKIVATPAKATAAKPAPAKAVMARPPAPRAASGRPAAAPPSAAAKGKAPAPAVPAPAAARPKAPEAEKKRGRRPRPRVHSSGVPVAAWLSPVKPRPASFIPAPPRAEAPSAVAAPPASSDRLIRPDDVAHPAVRTVPVRIDIEQGAGKFVVIASPTEVTVRVGEGIEWDFRYLGGADVSAEEVIIEFPKPSPFASANFKARKPGGARPHRQLSGAALASAAGKRIEYRVRAMSGFKSELASTTVAVNVTP